MTIRASGAFLHSERMLCFGQVIMCICRTLIELVCENPKVKHDILYIHLPTLRISNELNARRTMCCCWIFHDFFVCSVGENHTKVPSICPLILTSTNIMCIKIPKYMFMSKCSWIIRECLFSYVQFLFGTFFAYYFQCYVLYSEIGK